MSSIKLPPNEGESVPLSFRLGEKLFARVEQIAAETGLSKSDVMVHFTRWACDEYDADKKNQARDDDNFCSKCGQPLHRKQLDGAPKQRRSTDLRALPEEHERAGPTKLRRASDRKR